MLRLILLVLIIICSMSTYGQTGRPLGKEGYVLADLMFQEMKKVDYVFNENHPERGISDIRRMTLLRVLPTDTIYGFFSNCSLYINPYYVISSTIDKIVFEAREAPGHGGRGCFFPDGDERKYAQRAFLGLEESPDGSGHTMFIVKLLYKNGKFRVLDSKIHCADTGDIRFD